MTEFSLMLSFCISKTSVTGVGMTFRTLSSTGVDRAVRSQLARADCGLLSSTKPSMGSEPDMATTSGSETLQTISSSESWVVSNGCKASTLETISKEEMDVSEIVGEVIVGTVPMLRDMSAARHKESQLKIGRAAP